MTAFDLILLRPQEQTSQTVENVVHFETDFGDENTVHVEFSDETTESFSGIGLTPSGASI